MSENISCNNDKKIKMVKLVGAGISLAVLALLVFRFTFIVWYVIIAAVIASIGAPIVNFLKKRKITKKKYVPSWLAAAMALAILVLTCVAVIVLLVPLISKQASVVASINVSDVMSALKEPIQLITDYLVKFKLITSEQTIVGLIEEKLYSILEFSAVANIVGKVIGSLGGFLVSLVSILFITFFFLKEEDLFTKIVLVFVNEESHKKAVDAISHIKKFLSRYFIGLLAEVAGMFVLESIGLSAFGIKGALVLALMGSIFNLIPYAGPVIGTCLALIINALYMLSTGVYDQILYTSIVILSVFVVSNWVDNYFLQPYIFSKSTQAHPLEIFIVILVFGSFAGVLGMFLAIPGYTIMKVIAKEFLSQYEFIEEWTQNLKIDK